MPEEMILIQPAPVVRDEYGMFAHPDMPDFDEGDGDKCKAWIATRGLQVKMVSLEYHSDEAVSERYFEAGDPDCSYWEPDRPDGEGWFCLAIHDTDDGPVCWWARREVTPSSLPSGSPMSSSTRGPGHECQLQIVGKPSVRRAEHRGSSNSEYLMKNFAEAVIAIAPMGSRKSRNRFFRDYDRWTNRLLMRRLINLHERQDLRKQIAEAYLASLM